jgi:hypothetical protein
MSSTAFIVAKEKEIKRISSILTAQGYSEDENRKREFVDKLRDLLNGMTAWNPDIFLVHQSEGVLVADIQLPEERRAQYIPIAMKQAVPKIGSNFGPVKVVLYIPMGGVLEPETIQKAARLNVAIEAVNSAETICRILEPSTVCQCFEPSEEEKLAIESQRVSHWIIPRVLVQNLRNIKNLEYSSHLEQFATEYFHTPTPVRLGVQYKLASKCIENIIKSTYNLDLCCEPLQVSKGLQKMARRKGKSRDHFLHAFQTFLMGALVLDNYVGSSSPFVLCKRYPRIDLPWLLASIFHDFGFDLANLESCLDIAIGELKYESRGNLAYSTLLNSMYDFQKNDGDLDEWHPDSYVVRSSGLGLILFNAAIEKSAKATHERLRANHGVLSAHEIINLGERLSKEKSGLTQTFISSALSASMHDKTLWAELFSNSILPVDASRFPLLYLLILCDTLAEAGRPKTTQIGQEEAVLVNFDVRDNVIYCVVRFSEPEGACTMNFWSRFVQEKCFTNTPLKLECKCLS